jgi:hypothetical protein
MFNIKKNHKDKLYLLKRESSETSLFGDMITKGMVDAINKAVKLDYKQKVLFDFSIPNNGTKFYRHYTSEPQENYAVIHVGVFNSVYRYASVVINLTNERQEPYLLILDYDAISGDDKIVAQMVEKTLNWPFKGKAEHIRLEEREADDEYKRAILAYDCLEALRSGKSEGHINPLMQVGHENLKKLIGEGRVKKKEYKPRKSDNIKDYLPKGNNEGDEDMLLSLIGDTMKGKTLPLDILISLRFIILCKVIRKPPFRAFIKHYKYLEGKITVSSYNRITNKNNYYPIGSVLKNELIKKFNLYFKEENLLLAQNVE